LSFYLANPVGGTPNFFNLTFGNSSFSFTNFGTAFGWQQFVLTTVATSNQTQLSFAFRNDPDFWFLDNVNLQQSGGTVPEPGTRALFGSGVIGIAAFAVVSFAYSSYRSSHDFQAAIKNGGFICCRTSIKNDSSDPGGCYRYDISHNVRHRKRARSTGKNTPAGIAKVADSRRLRRKVRCGTRKMKSSFRVIFSFLSLARLLGEETDSIYKRTQASS
jgi:hypothetical protein